MHELPATQNILDIAVDEAKKAGASRITAINIVIGELSSFIDESIQMYFDIISEGTAAYGAKLIFKRIPAVFACRRCGAEFNLKSGNGDDSDNGGSPNSRKGRVVGPYAVICQHCGGNGVLADKARDFYIDSVEVDIDNAD